MYGVSPCEIFGAEIGTGIGFSQSPLVFPVSIIPLILMHMLHTYIYILIHRSIICTRWIECCYKRNGCHPIV